MNVDGAIKRTTWDNYIANTPSVCSFLVLKTVANFNPWRHFQDSEVKGGFGNVLYTLAQNCEYIPCIIASRITITKKKNVISKMIR